jgi:hypothetical protein
MKTFYVFATSVVMANDKKRLHLPDYCLCMGESISLYSRLLSRYHISIQKLMSISKKYSLSVYKENIPHIGNTYIVCHNDMEVLQNVIDELNSIVLLHELGER